MKRYQSSIAIGASSYSFWYHSQILYKDQPLDLCLVIKTQMKIKTSTNIIA
jgi:hypothetical protein